MAIKLHSNKNRGAELQQSVQQFPNKKAWGAVIIIVVFVVTLQSQLGGKLELLLKEESTNKASTKDGALDNGYSSKIIFSDTERPKNLHIALIGDSVTRFQYAALSFYLHHGHHVTTEDRPNPLRFKVNRRAKYHDFSNRLLYPNEQCDCYRPTKWLPLTFFDSRYFYDPIRNNSVTFILKYGLSPSQGHWWPEDVHKPHNLTLTYDKYIEPEWTGNWSVAFEHLAKLTPKPKYVIFNAGHHWHDLGSEVVRKAIRSTLEQLGLIGIYKYTTFSRNKKSRTIGNHEPFSCANMDNRCINYDWTFNLTGDQYFDHVHLREGPNRRMNEELLAYLKELDQSM